MKFHKPLRYTWQHDYFNPFQKFTFPRSRYMRPWLMAKPKPIKKTKTIKRPTHDYHQQTYLRLLPYYKRRAIKEHHQRHKG